MSADHDDSGGGGDDDGDDLRALRSVWLAMREADEEPPERGMAELMAAARAHAKEAPEPLRVPAWRGWLAALVRPPVLAFATVVLVAGTAVVVKTHGGLDVAEQSAAPGPAQPPPSPAGAVTAQVESSPAAAAAAPAAADPMGDRGAAEAPADVAAAPAPAVAAPEPAPARRVQLSAPYGKASAPKHMAKKPVADDDEGAFAKAEVAKMPAPVPVPAEAAPGRKFAKPPPPVSNDQLLRECQAAAARGDCRAVASFAERMRAQDAAFYKDTFSRDAAIAKCLTVSAD